MTIHEWLTDTIAALTGAHIETARLDSLVLLCDELVCDKSWVLGHPEYVLQRSEIKNLSTKITQRVKHVPLAYLRGHAEFYGREFIVNEHVLVPRPESEAIIELLKKLPPGQRTTIIDIGTGSGALAITAALEFPGTQVLATDIDTSALEIAQENAKRLQATIRFMQGDLLQTFPDSAIETPNAIVLANLPYVPDAYPINRAATHEPSLALFGGSDGLELYGKLCAQLAVLKHKPTHMIAESLVMQHKKLADIMYAIGYIVQSTDGLAQCFAYKLR